jgi:hypothetical protein
MTGRPSDFTDEIATRICDLLMDGLSMRSICQADDMPHRTTVVRWLERYPEFASMYAHARTLQADLMDDMILETTTGHQRCRGTGMVMELISSLSSLAKLASWRRWVESVLRGLCRMSGPAKEASLRRPPYHMEFI